MESTYVFSNKEALYVSKYLLKNKDISLEDSLLFMHLCILADQRNSYQLLESIEDLKKASEQKGNILFSLEKLKNIGAIESYCVVGNQVKIILKEIKEFGK